MSRWGAWGHAGQHDAADAASDLVNSLILPYDLLLELVGHPQQADALALGDALGGHASHHGDYLSDMPLVDSHAAAVKLGFPALLGYAQFFLQLLLLVTVTGRTLKVLGLHCLEFVILGLGNALLQVFNFLGSINFSDMYA